MSQLLTEEAGHGWLDGALDSPSAGPPVNPTAPGPPEITTPDAVAIAPAPTMPNAATIPPSPSAYVTATGQLDATTPSAPAASSAPDVPTAGDSKPGKRRSTRIAGK